MNNLCKAYIDGENYFHDVADAINLAKSEVFITGWWISP